MGGFVALLVAAVLLISTGMVSFNPEMVAEYMTYIIAAVVILYFAIMFISPKLDKTDMPHAFFFEYANDERRQECANIDTHIK